jgi:hypothetical protein
LDLDSIGRWRLLVTSAGACRARAQHFAGTLLVKKPKRRDWTAEDVRELKQFAKAKTPAARIARKLKRTEGATRQKALTLNVSLDSRVTKPKPALKKAAMKKSAAKQTAAKKDA